MQNSSLQAKITVIFWHKTKIAIPFQTIIKVAIRFALKAKIAKDEFRPKLKVAIWIGPKTKIAIRFGPNAKILINDKDLDRCSDDMQVHL